MEIKNLLIFIFYSLFVFLFVVTSIMFHKKKNENLNSMIEHKKRDYINVMADQADQITEIILESENLNTNRKCNIKCQTIKKKNNKLIE